MSVRAHRTRGAQWGAQSHTPHTSTRRLLLDTIALVPAHWRVCGSGGHFSASASQRCVCVYNVGCRNGDGVCIPTKISGVRATAHSPPCHTHLHAYARDCAGLLLSARCAREHQDGGRLHCNLFSPSACTNNLAVFISGAKCRWNVLIFLNPLLPEKSIISRSSRFLWKEGSLSCEVNSTLFLPNTPLM